jgi:iron(III) transport system substrate-binding protein
MFKRSLLSLMALAAVSSTLLSINTAQAQGTEKVLNLYSARHYSTDEALYSTFTKTTGIKINRVDSDDAGILTRLKAEGAASPADLILLVDAARLTSADAQGLFQPIKSKLLDDSIPANLRSAATADGVTWTGFSTRARVIVYDKVKVKKEDVATYEQLADPKNQGKVCTRSGSHPYNLSLFSTMMEHMAKPKPKFSSKVWLTTWRAHQKVATPTRSKASQRANAALRCPTPTTSPA